MENNFKSFSSLVFIFFFRFFKLLVIYPHVSFTFSFLFYVCIHLSFLQVLLRLFEEGDFGLLLEMVFILRFAILFIYFFIFLLQLIFFFFVISDELWLVNLKAQR